MAAGVEARWRVAGFCYDHMHIGDLLRLATELPNTELVGTYDPDPARMAPVCERLGLPEELRFTDWKRCVEETRPDIVCVCSATPEHVTWVERLAPLGVHIMLEKPFAADLAQVDRMLDATKSSPGVLTVNWPLAWYPPHRTTQRLIAEGVIGDVIEVHYYDGNQGPLRHLGPEERRATWWYREGAGGGSMRDYLGYGTTLATWFRGGEAPNRVTATAHVPPGEEVDTQAVVVASYPSGLSVFQTRWGTFTNPWTHQPQPRCGFVVVGSAGTISSYDYRQTVRLQTAKRPDGLDVPVDGLASHVRTGLAFLTYCLETGREVDGPMSVAVSRTGQRIVDAAVESLSRKAAVEVPA